MTDIDETARIAHQEYVANLDRAAELRNREFAEKGEKARARIAKHYAMNPRPETRNRRQHVQKV